MEDSFELMYLPGFRFYSPVFRDAGMEVQKKLINLTVTPCSPG